TGRRHGGVQSREPARETVDVLLAHALRARARPAVYPTRQARGRRYVDVEDSRGNAGDQGHARYAQPDVQSFPVRNLRLRPARRLPRNYFEGDRSLRIATRRRAGHDGPVHELLSSLQAGPLAHSRADIEGWR